MRYFVLIMLGIACLATPASARPVSYPGGWTFMTMNDADKYSVHMHYSPTINYSVGYKGEYDRGGDYSLHALQVNNLLKRWNKKDSQANLYLKSGVGVVYTDQGAYDSETSGAAFTGLATDWEDRRYFVSYENRYLEAGALDDKFSQAARVGITPYIGDYGDLHTWLMLQVNHTPEAKDKVTVTPMVRFFKSVNLMEAGISNKGDLMFNWVMRY